MPQHAIPEAVTLSADRAWLTATWSDGTQVRLGAGRLRAACRCADCVRARADDAPVSTTGITISAVQPYGPHVGRITFSDGHDRGLFPWSWLLEIAAAEPVA
ncbi:MAG TPA: gamma-butyrobetaine hydroxylase-like domain-containing protein [Acetobacteraceae bacterium]|jgi:DUF971 family protein